MNVIRLIAAVLLAIPLTVFGANHFLEFFTLPEGDPNAGTDLLAAMRGGGLMTPIALSHIAIGFLLVIPATRFAGGLLQLPMSLGIVAFHVTMLPEGNVVAFVMLGLNLVVLAEPKQLKSLVASADR